MISERELVELRLWNAGGMGFEEERVKVQGDVILTLGQIFILFFK